MREEEGQLKKISFISVLLLILPPCKCPLTTILWDNLHSHLPRYLSGNLGFFLAGPMGNACENESQRRRRKYIIPATSG